MLNGSNKTSTTTKKIAVTELTINHPTQGVIIANSGHQKWITQSLSHHDF